MTANSMIQIALAVCVLYMLFSLLTTVFNEWIGRWTGWRRIFLREELKRLLGCELMDQLTSHPLYLVQRVGRAEGKDPSYLLPQVFAMIFIDLTVKYTPSTTPGYPGSVSVNSTLSNAASKTLAESLILYSNNLDSIQTRVMKWFELSMEQVSGRYKRAIQVINFIFAVAVCAAANLDTARIT